MAVLDGTRVKQMWSDNASARTVLYALDGVTAGDTFDTSQQFNVLKRAVLLGTTVVAGLSVSVSGNVITIPAGANGDAGYVLAYGASA
jgi:hypothetical protein